MASRHPAFGGINRWKLKITHLKPKENHLNQTLHFLGFKILIFRGCIIKCAFPNPFCKYVQLFCSIAFQIHAPKAFYFRLFFFSEDIHLWLARGRSSSHFWGLFRLIGALVGLWFRPCRMLVCSQIARATTQLSVHVRQGEAAELYLSIYLPIYLPIYLSTYLSI